MCAAVSPLDRYIIISRDNYRVEPFIGPNATQDDCIRRWCHWAKTDNPRVLWDPINGYRRQAEWDDHGESYPMSKDGPDLWYLLEIKPKGMFRLGMYFFNKDGHNGANRMRDYLIEIYQSEVNFKGDPASYPVWQKYSRMAEQVTRSQKTLVKSRMHDFWGGVYKQFLLKGECNYWVKIDRNYSFNTIISAVMIEQVQGEPLDNNYLGIPFISSNLSDENAYKKSPMPLPKNYDSGIGRHIGLLWNTIDEKYDQLGGANLQRENKLIVYRASTHYEQDSVDIQQLTRAIKFRLNLWDDIQRKEWRESMETAFKKIYEENESIRKTIESHKDGPPKFFLDRKK
jgi:hypothetical protein